MSKVFDTRKGKQIWTERTICEVHREIYDLLFLNIKDTPLFGEVLPLLEEAYIDGMKLTKRLVDNKISLPKWEKNNSEEGKRLRELRVHLAEELERCQS